MVSIINLIKQNKVALSDVTGSKPLITLADQVKSNTADISDNEIVNQVRDIDFVDLSIEETNILLSFLQSSRIMKPALISNLKLVIIERLTENSKEIVNKRGLIYRYLALTDKSVINANEILSDKNLYEFSPWLWFDVTVLIVPSKAFQGLRHYFNKKGGKDDVLHLINRLPFINSKVSRSEYLTELSELLLIVDLKGNLDNRDILDKWIKKFKIEKMKLTSISKLINKTSLSSKSLLN